MTTETIDKLYLELSLVSTATTAKEIKLQAEIDELHARVAEQDKLLEQALVALKSTGIMWPIVAAAVQAIEGRTR
jgi:hypothetical protein